jgi:hypothetical protein
VAMMDKEMSTCLISDSRNTSTSRVHLAASVAEKIDKPFSAHCRTLKHIATMVVSLEDTKKTTLFVLSHNQIFRCHDRQKSLQIGDYGEGRAGAHKSYF